MAQDSRAKRSTGTGGSPIDEPLSSFAAASVTRLMTCPAAAAFGNACGMTASDAAAPLLKLGDDCSLTSVDGTIHSGHPVGHVEDVAQIP